MDSSSTHKPQIPFRASSEGQSPPPRSSREDSDASITRKRPRLDNGERTYRSLSAGPTSSTSTLRPLTTPEEDAIIGVAIEEQPMSSPRSKVTLNIKEQSARTQSNDHPQSNTEDMEYDATDEVPEPPGMDQTLASQTSPPRSRSPSPLDSPKIEIAEPEDAMATGPTVWRRSGQRTLEERRNELMNGTGFSSDNYREALNKLSSIILYEDSELGMILTQLSDFLDEWTSIADDYSTSIRDLWIHDLELWQGILDLVYDIIKRNRRAFIQRPKSKGRDLIIDLTRDDTPTTTFAGHKRRHNEPFIRLFNSLSALLCRVLRMDCWTLCNLSTDEVVESDLFGKVWLQTLFFHFFAEDHHGTLRTWTNARFSADVQYAEMMMEFIVDDGPKFLTLCASYLIEKTSTDLDYAVHLLQLSHLILKWISTEPSCPAMVKTTNYEYTLQLYSKFSARIQDKMKKQASGFSVELIKKYIQALTECLALLCQVDYDRTIERLPQLKDEELETYVDCNQMDNKSRSWVLKMKVAFDICLDCIKHGRMEARVAGVDACTQLLLDTHSEYINRFKTIDKGELHPVIKFVTSLIKQKEFIEYLVGVNSHYQLVSRARNLVGFQVVTRHYDQNVTNTLWSAMLSSQDVKMSAEILSLMMAQTAYGEAIFQETFVEKLKHHPLAAFDARMFEFTHELLLGAVKKEIYEHSSFVEDICTEVLIPMLRQCQTNAAISVMHRQELQHFARQNLHKYMGYSSDNSNKLSKQICDTAIQDIQAGGPTATAGVMLILMLLQKNYCDSDHEGTSIFLTNEFLELITKDLESCAELMQAMGSDNQIVGNVLQPRIHLFETLLRRNIAWPATSNMERIWQSLVGKGAMNDTARELGFAELGRLLEQSARGSRSQFLEFCITAFPHLESKYMIPATIEFATRANYYFEKQLRGKSDCEKGSTLPGDIFWHLALNAEHPRVVEKAVLEYVKQNFEGPCSLPGPARDDFHVRLVDRCIEYLTIAAVKIKSSDEDDTQDSISDSFTALPMIDKSNCRTYLRRSLQVLKVFLERVRKHRIGSPVLRMESPLSNHSVHGEEVEYTFRNPQVNSGNSRLEKLSIGLESTYKDLKARISKRVGLSGVRIYAGGRPVDGEAQDDHQLHTIQLLAQSKNLLVTKTPGAEVIKESMSNYKMLPLELQVMAHFNTLYALLELDDTVGNEVYEFLTSFPPNEDILTKSTAELVPVQSPWKTVYSCYVFKRRLEARFREGGQCEPDLLTVVSIIGQALIDIVSQIDKSFNAAPDVLIHGMVECLSIALKEGVSEKTASEYFPDASRFVHSILELLILVCAELNSSRRVEIVYLCFTVALEAAVKSNSAWEAFKSHPDTNAILKMIWLETNQVPIRTNTVRTLKSICSAFGTINTLNRTDFYTFFWRQIVLLIPQTTSYPHQAKQFFEIAMIVFRGMSVVNTVQLSLADYFKNWADVLIKHKSIDCSPHREDDDVVDGVVELMTFALQLMKSSDQSVEGDSELIEKIFDHHVFPKGYLADIASQAFQVDTPVLSSGTRAKLYGLLILLVSSTDTFHTLNRCVARLVDSNESRAGMWSHGIAQLCHDSTEASWNIKRNEIVRARSGYAGLKNLSSTCYLNSLFMQLFMNLRFREFIFQNSIRGGDQEGLVFETQRLFAYLQETFLKAVDPMNVIQQIVTYDNESIDVTIQMDADEFYNLLFDRWESHLPTAADKRTFRSFYGGELVQQIKSQNCPHVSERIESFSVIQCEVQGKVNLGNSLQSFIEGEMMQGDNKYKCGTCDTYVNAVKRACLRHVPDNVIFHLKRFDYDLSTGMRHKINESFEFPEDIDLSKYNIEYLQDPSNPPKPDMFKLVGILVHAGNAEAGHYYSYIRERSGLRATWVEMNDADVTEFDPCNIPAACYGGIDQNINYWKNYSAYMLFYQRFESIQEDAIAFPIVNSEPPRLPLPQDLAEQLYDENHRLNRTYCMLDPAYTNFLRLLLQKYQQIFTNEFSPGYKVEKSLTCEIIKHLDLVVARCEEFTYVEELIRALEKIVLLDSECAGAFLQAITQPNEIFRALVFKCPTDVVKENLADLIINCLDLIQEDEPATYGPRFGSPKSSHSEELMYQDLGAFAMIIEACNKVNPYIPGMFRNGGWDQYWSFLRRLASRGKYELAQVHSGDHFYRALQIALCTEGCAPLKDWTFAQGFCKNWPKGGYGMRGVAELLAVVLRELIDNLSCPVEERLESLVLSIDEVALLAHQIVVDARRQYPVNTVLHGILQWGLEEAALDHVVRALVMYSQTRDNDSCLQDYLWTLSRGATSAVEVNSSSTYLAASLTFARSCPHQEMVDALIDKFAEGTTTIGSEAGQEHLRFFQHLCMARNPHISDNLFFKHAILKTLPKFSPTLLCYPEELVRKGTQHLITSMMLNLNLSVMDDEEELDNISKHAKTLVSTCVYKLRKIVTDKRLYDIKRLEQIQDVIRDLIEKYWPEEEGGDELQKMLEAFTELQERIPIIAATSPDAVESVEYSDDSDVMSDGSVP